MVRVAVFGGVFDPVHNGHIRAAEIVDSCLHPDVLLFVPAGRPPHKRGRRINTCADRLNMLKIAVEGAFGNRAVVCDFEVNSSELSYTANTLAHLKAVYGRDCELYFAIGADNISKLKTWHRPDIIRALSTLAVVARPGFDQSEAKLAFPESVICEGESVRISSTFIRKLASEGQDFSQYLPEGVYDYIKKRGLYPKEVTDPEEIIKFLSAHAKDSRIMHTKNVRDEAVKLAQKYGADVKKAEIAALIHDAAKNLSLQDMLNFCEEYDIITDNLQRKQKSLLHSIVAEGMAFFKLGISDTEILDAIRYHTTGCQDMETLTKIIYLADCIEPLRTYAGVGKLRTLAYESLDKACFLSLDGTIAHLLKSGFEIHTDTLEARNYFLSEGN